MEVTHFTDDVATAGGIEGDADRMVVPLDQKFEASGRTRIGRTAGGDDTFCDVIDARRTRETKSLEKRLEFGIVIRGGSVAHATPPRAACVRSLSSPLALLDASRKWTGKPRRPAGAAG